MAKDLARGVDEILSALTGMRKDIEERSKGEDVPGRSRLPSRSHTPKAHNKVQVQVRMTLRRIFNVDTVKQTFGAQVFVEMMWKAPPGESLPEDGDSEWQPDWTPKYRFRRVMEDNGMEQQYYPKTVIDESYIVCETDHLLGISEQLELQSFPVDVQDLSIEVLSSSSVDKVRWLPCPKEEGPLCKLNKARVALNDFSLVNEIPITFQLTTTKSNVESSCLNVDVKIARQATYYYINVALVMLIIVSFTLTAWATHPADIAGRQGVDFTLLLTAVAYKLVLASMLPNVSYMTLLDKYVMAGFLFLTAVSTVHTLLPFRTIGLLEMSSLTRPPSQLGDGHLEQALIDDDKLAFYVFLSIWVAFNVSFFLGLLLHGHHLYASFRDEAKHEQAKFDQQIEDARPLTC